MIMTSPVVTVTDIIFLHVSWFGFEIHSDAILNDPINYLSHPEKEWNISRIQLLEKLIKMEKGESEILSID